MQPCQEHISPTIVFFGTSEFGAIILEKLVQVNLSPVLVVTTPDMPAGRKQLLIPSPVKIIAERFKLPILQSSDLLNSAIAELSRQKKADMFIVASYGKILPKAVLDIPKFGTLNVHPSLLPKYRGPSPVQTALLNGEEETGVTIMLIDEKVDHGPILANYKLQITNNKYTYTELHNKLAELGAELLIETIPQWIEKKIKPVLQDDARATYTKIFTKQNGKIQWEDSAQKIERQVRALNPWPGTYTRFNNKLLKILKGSVLEMGNESERKPGEVFLTQDKKLAIQTGDNALLVEQLQLEGGKQVSAKDFLLGHKDLVGTVLK